MLFRGREDDSDHARPYASVTKEDIMMRACWNLLLFLTTSLVEPPCSCHTASTR